MKASTQELVTKNDDEVGLDLAGLYVTLEK